MWPFAGLLNALSLEVLVPGQDSPATWSAFANYPNTAYAGIRFRTNGSLDLRDGLSSYIEQTNMWIHDAAKNIVDANLYECRYTSVTGDTAYLVGPALGTWHSLHIQREWYIFANSRGRPIFTKSAEQDIFPKNPEFAAPITQQVSGIIQVREKANTGNTRSGNLTLRARHESLL